MTTNVGQFTEQLGRFNPLARLLIAGKDWETNDFACGGVSPATECRIEIGENDSAKEEIDKLQEDVDHLEQITADACRILQPMLEKLNDIPDGNPADATIEEVRQAIENAISKLED